MARIRHSSHISNYPICFGFGVVLISLAMTVLGAFKSPVRGQPAVFLETDTLAISSKLALNTITSPAQDESWKRRNDKGNRFEGLVSISTGNPDLEVLSFTGFFERFNRNVNLRVRFFLPSLSSLSITAQEIEDQKQYLMVAKPQAWSPGVWNEFSPWPTDVVLREGISSDNVGVLITLAQSSQLAPAFVYYSRTPNVVDSYTMYLRSNRNLRRVKLSLYGTDHSTVRSWALGQQSANVPFPVNLDTRGFPEGTIRLVIERELSGVPQKPPIREYSFYHKAN